MAGALARPSPECAIESARLGIAEQERHFEDGQILVVQIHPREVAAHLVDQVGEGDVGIVTGRVLAKVKMQAKAMTEDVRFTRVYRRSSSGWQMVAGQGTRIAEGARIGDEGT